MTVKELKERLACFSDDDHLIVNWWSQEEFDIPNKKQWLKLCQHAEREIDWEIINDQISEMAMEAEGGFN